MADKKQTTTNKTKGLPRRAFLKRTGLFTTAAVAMPHIWVPNSAIAQTSARGAVKHLLYIRLAGGFRFTAAFNGDVGAEFNPFGLADNVAEGTQWGVSSLLASANWLDGENGGALRELGMTTVPEIANRIAVLPCVDHEPLAGNADGNHGTGLERYLTGYVNGPTSIFTMINYGLRQRYEDALAQGDVVLPAFVLGNSGMARGVGQYAAYRPPLMDDGGFDRFGFDADGTLPDWAVDMSAQADIFMRDRQHPQLKDKVDAYLRTRRATKDYSEIFQSDTLKIRERGQVAEEVIDGISNAQLATIFGDDRSARNIRLALRLFHFGSPAVYLDQGGYDYHSGEEASLPPRIDSLNRLISGLYLALNTMTHPTGGTYWDHTLVVLGSEFGRTARGGRFNSARGSDHGGDRATRWMSMPFMGGVISKAGQQLGATSRDDLKDDGRVYSYRSVCKTLMDALGCDHQEFFPADEPFDDLFS